MLVTEVAARLDLRVLAQGNDRPVTGCYVADLLSDVIANAEEGHIWVTVQRHLNIIAVAQLKKVAAILVPRDCLPAANVLERATELGIFVLQGNAGSFELCGLLYNLLRPPA